MMRISRQAIFVNCWYASRPDLLDVWPRYGGRDRDKEGKDSAVAVRSSIGALKAALQTSSRKVHISNVSYINYVTEPIPLGNAFLSALHKDASLQPEQEVRALFLQAGLDSTAFSPGPEQGVDVEIDPGALIEEVLLAPHSGEWFHTLVAAVCRRYQTTAPIISKEATGPM
jgi:hypothetical protein